MASSSNSKIALPSVVLVLRLLTLVLLAGALALIVTDRVNVDLPGFDPPKFTLNFKDIYAYRYVLGIAVVGCAYTLLQIPLAAVAIAMRKRVIGGKANVALFLICADVIFALAFATGAGAGFGFTYDAKRDADKDIAGFDRSLRDRADVRKLHHDVDRFFLRAYAAAALMLLAAACMAFTIMTSVYALVK